MTDLTPRRLAILHFIDAYREDKGYPPSMRAIQQGCGISSVSVVYYNVSWLIDLGFLEYDTIFSRTVHLSEKGRDALNEHRR